MCDYSLHGINNRLAKDGEQLVIHRFSTGSKGLTSPKNLNPPKRKKGLARLLQTDMMPKECAVCVPDGTVLVIQDVHPVLQRKFGLSTTEVVTFRQLTIQAMTYRDAFKFQNDEIVCLQEVEEGQKVKVLSLSLDELVRNEEFLDVRA